MKHPYSLLPLKFTEENILGFDLWTCITCGKEMLKVSEFYLACQHGHGLHRAPRIEDLPCALRAIYRGGIPCRVFPTTRLFTITGHSGFWRYVPHAHKKALDRRPKAGTVIGRVILRNGSAQARIFRQVK